VPKKEEEESSLQTARATADFDEQTAIIGDMIRSNGNIAHERSTGFSRVGSNPARCGLHATMAEWLRRWT
jgi:hypothetical protein